MFILLTATFGTNVLYSLIHKLCLPFLGELFFFGVVIITEKQGKSKLEIVRINRNLNKTGRLIDKKMVAGNTIFC